MEGEGERGVVAQKFGRKDVNRQKTMLRQRKTVIRRLKTFLRQIKKDDSTTATPASANKTQRFGKYKLSVGKSRLSDRSAFPFSALNSVVLLCKR